MLFYLWFIFIMQIQEAGSIAVVCFLFFICKRLGGIDLGQWKLWLIKHAVLKVMALSLMFELSVLPLSFWLLTLLKNWYAIKHQNLVNYIFLGLILIPWLMKSISVIRFVKDTKKRGHPSSNW